MRVFVDLLSFSDNIFQMVFPSVTALVGGQAVEHSLIRSLLHVNIERGIDFQSAFVHLIGAVLVLQIAPDFFDEIRRQRIGIVREMQGQRLGAGVRPPARP